MTQPVKVASSFDIERSQKLAMYTIYRSLGIPQTKQVKLGLDQFFQTHKKLLEKDGFKFNSDGEITYHG